MVSKVETHEKKEKIKKRAIPIALVVVIIVAGVYYSKLKQKGEYAGVVDGVMVTHAAEVSGKIVSCPVQLGSEVRKGDTIAVIDDTTQQYAIEQLNLNLQKAKLAVGSTTLGKGGTADNNYNAAQAAYKNAQSTLNKASEDYQNAKDLYAGAAISKDKLDAAKVAYDAAASGLETAKAGLHNVTDTTASSGANLDVSLLESQLAQQQENLEKYIIKATCDGTVMSLNYRIGDVVQSGYDVADVSDITEKYALFYFPKDDLSQLKIGQKVMVYLTEDSNQKSKRVEGLIKSIDVKSEYTPKDLQTAANRDMESVKIKALLPEDCTANPGEEVRIGLSKL